MRDDAHGSEPGPGRLRAWGWNDWVAGAARAGVGVGRVVRVDRGECDVVTGVERIRVLSSSVRAQPDLAPVTGDWVEVFRRDGTSTIDRVVPRRTELYRRGPDRQQQVLAANFDLVGIVAGLDRPLRAGLFERLLVMAGDSGAAVLILLTKADRPCDESDQRAGVAAVAGEVPIVMTSLPEGRGLDEIRRRLGPGRTLVLVGASGAGKSSLANALARAELLPTAAVRSSDARGRHTTIARELILLPDGAGLVLDTPGLRSLAPWDAEAALDRVFGDLGQLSADCRFSNCAHDTEPGCAVQTAIDEGELDGRRFERYQALRRELAEQKARRW